MGILNNLENAWDDNFDSEPILDWCKTGMPQFESAPIVETDAMGRERFWQDMGRPTEDTSLAVKLFSETCCSECSCKQVKQ
jgi:hypothetical protein